MKMSEWTNGKSTCKMILRFPKTSRAPFCLQGVGGKAHNRKSIIVRIIRVYIYFSFLLLLDFSHLIGNDQQTVSDVACDFNQVNKISTKNNSVFVIFKFEILTNR